MLCVEALVIKLSCPSWILSLEVCGPWSHSPLSQNSSDGIFLFHVEFLMPLSLHCSIISQFLISFCWQMLLVSVLIVSHPISGTVLPSIIFSTPAPRPSPDASISSKGALVYCKISCMPLSWSVSLHFCVAAGIASSWHIQHLKISVFIMAHPSLPLLVRTCSGNSWCPGMILAHSLSWVVVSLWMHTACNSPV